MTFQFIWVEHEHRPKQRLFYLLQDIVMILSTGTNKYNCHKQHTERQDWQCRWIVTHLACRNVETAGIFDSSSLSTCGRAHMRKCYGRIFGNLSLGKNHFYYYYNTVQLLLHRMIFHCTLRLYSAARAELNGRFWITFWRDDALSTSYSVTVKMEKGGRQ